MIQTITSTNSFKTKDIPKEKLVHEFGNNKMNDDIDKQAVLASSTKDIEMVSDYLNTIALSHLQVTVQIGGNLSQDAFQ